MRLMKTRKLTAEAQRARRFAEKGERTMRVIGKSSCAQQSLPAVLFSALRCVLLSSAVNRALL